MHGKDVCPLAGYVHRDHPHGHTGHAPDGMSGRRSPRIYPHQRWRVSIPLLVWVVQYHAPGVPLHAGSSIVRCVHCSARWSPGCMRRGDRPSTRYRVPISSRDEMGSGFHRAGGHGQVWHLHTISTLEHWWYCGMPVALLRYCCMHCIAGGQHA